MVSVNQIVRKFQIELAGAVTSIRHELFFPLLTPTTISIRMERELHVTPD
jgi:hypothetical protein